MMEAGGTTALGDFIAQKQAEPEPSPPPVPMKEAIGDAFQVYRLLKVGCAAVFCVFLGLAMILTPEFRDNPRTISGADVARGLCAGLVGLVLIGLVLLSTRRRQ